MLDAGYTPDGVIKTSISDFVVREVHGTTVLSAVSENDIRPRENKEQEFTLFKLSKRGVAAESAYRSLAREFGVQRWQITDCGMKDAFAYTTQYVVVEGSYIPRCSDDRLRLQYIGPANGPLRHGGHSANYFSIHVKTSAAQPPYTDGSFINFFGPQRFGDGYLDVGRLLLSGDTAAAVESLRGSLGWNHLHNIADRNDCSLEEAFLSPAYDYQRHFKVMQWRSKLWNDLAAMLPEEETLPLWDSGSAPLYAKHGLWDFDPALVPKSLRSEVFSSSRPVTVKAYGYEIERTDEGFRYKFALKSGCYATVFLASMYNITDASLQRN